MHLYQLYNINQWPNPTSPQGLSHCHVREGSVTDILSPLCPLSKTLPEGVYGIVTLNTRLQGEDPKRKENPNKNPDDAPLNI